MNENATPAQKLYVELTTRIVSQKLHYRSGSEETAASSVSSVFASTRKLLTEHADAVLFERVALALLNGVMRPYTARWHGWMTADVRDLDASGKPNLKFRDERVRRMFRAELVELQGKIQPYLDMLTSLKSASDEKHSAEDCFCHDDLTQLTSDESSTPSAKLGGPLIAGISDAVAFTGKLKGQDLFSKERETIAKRRKALGLEHTEDTDDTQGKEGNLANAAGLALSGGGIRSATFCLGVVQVLQKHGLLLNFDYLSTVSGGGYLGAFLSCALGTESPKPKSFKGTEAPASVTLEPLATEPVTARPASLETKPTAEPVPHIYDNARTTETFQRHGEQTESSLLRHMRNNSKYLLNGGLAAKLQITGLMVTGFLWNLFMVVPIPIFAAVLVVWLKDWLWGTGALEADTLFPPLFDGFHGRFLLASGFCLVVLWFILPLIQWWARRKDSDTWRQRFRTIEEAANWWGLTTAAIAALYLLPALIIGYGALAEKLVSLNPNWLLNSNLGDIASLSSAAVFSITLGLLATWITPRLPILRTLAVNLFILSGPLLMLLVFLFVCHRLGMATNHAEWNPWNPLSVIVVTAIVLFWIWFLVDINTLAPHRYYRKKLCECYLTRRSTGESGVESLQR